MNSQKGITLIALVISIIVMLILAGVSINTIIGEDGILTKAKNAMIMSKYATYQEELELNTVDNTGVYAAGDNIKKYISSISEEDLDKFVIIKSKLAYIAYDEQEKNIASSLGLDVGESEMFDSKAAIKEIQNIVSGVVELKNKYEDKIPKDDSQLLDEPEHKNNAEGLIGVRLFDRNGLNILNKTWNIVDEYNISNEKIGRYGSGYYYLKKGETYIIDGESIEFKNNYLIDYAKGEYIILSERAVNWNINTTIAVIDGMALNIDPMSLEDGEWVNNTTLKTYDIELSEANNIEDENERKLKLEELDKTFYNFYVTNPITLIKTDTGIQKVGDIKYDVETKSLSFNESENNLKGQGGYLSLLNPVDFSNGFTFEMYMNLDRIQSDGSISKAQSMGLFCRNKYLGYDRGSAFRFLGAGEENINSMYTLFKLGWGSSSRIDGENLSSEAGEVHLNKECNVFEVNKDVYFTFSYIRCNEANKDKLENYAYLKQNNYDMIYVYKNGEKIGSCYFLSADYSRGLSSWNNDDFKFYVGVCPWNGDTNFYYTQGKVYSTRLYEYGFSAEDAKNNYDMTIKYRASF